MEQLNKKLLSAAQSGKTDEVVACLQSGADINYKGSYGMTALHWAALYGHDRIVKILVEGGGDINVQDNEGKTALHWAAEYGRDRIVEILVEGGGDINVQDNLGKTALHWAAIGGHDRIVEILVEGGGDVNVQDNEGRTALHKAAWKGHDRIVEILVEGGGDINVQDNLGKTALHRAALYGHDRMVEILVEGGGDINVQDDNGSTPLHMAVQKQDWDSTDAIERKERTAAVLVQLGSDMYVKDNQGKTPLDYCTEDLKGSLEILASQIVEIKAKFPRLANVKEFRVLLSKGTYMSYNNRLYFAGACNVGKTTLASNFIGEDISLYWNSTDGLKIYFGRNGIDLKRRKMVPLIKGQDSNILSNILRGKPSFEQLPKSIKKTGLLNKLRQLFRRSRRERNLPATAKSTDLQTSFRPSSLAHRHPVQPHSNAKNEVPEEKEQVHGSQKSAVITKQDHADIHKRLREEVTKGQYQVDIAPSDLVDFGGQRAYDLTHQLFIQQKGAFVLLLDGRKNLDDVLPEYQQTMTARDILLHWVNSILTYCAADDDDIYPLIVFAATYSDELSKREQSERFKKITKQLTDMFSNHEHYKRIKIDQLFFINATDREDPGVQALKQYLVSVAFQQKSWGESMPMAWVPLELKIAEMRSENIFIIAFNELFELNLCNGDLSMTDKQFKHFLRCQHSLGRLMYFDINRLDRYIIVQPTGMVDVLRSFITDEIFWPIEPSLKHILGTACETGIIKKKDLMKLWAQDEFNKYIPTPEMKEFLTQVLVHLDILVEPKRYLQLEHNLLDTFIVPCMVKQSLPSTYLPVNLDDNKTIFLSYRLSKSAIPNALAFKLIGAVLNIWPLKRKDELSCLFDKAAVLEIDQTNDLYLTFKDNRFIVALSNTKSNSYISPDVASVIQECLTLTMTKALEFYLSSFGKSTSLTDISKLFTIEVGAKCGEGMCFVSLNEITNEKFWTCDHNNEHSAQYPLYWIFDQKQVMCVYDCQGLGPHALNDVPEDRHLIRLAKLIGREFNQFIIYLGLTKAEWDDIEQVQDNRNYNERLIQKFIGLLEWKKHEIARDISPTFKSLSKALLDIEYSEHYLCQIFREKFTQVFAMDNPRLQGIPADSVLQELSHNIGHHTLHLGVELGVVMTSIEETQFKYSKDMFAQTFDILSKWKTTCNVKPTVRSLMLALQYVDPRGFHFLKETYGITKKNQESETETLC